MAKKKRSKKDPQIIRELSLLISGLSYLSDRLKNTDKNDKNPDVILAESLCNAIGYIVKRFSIPTQQKAIRLNELAQHLANEDYNKYKGIEPIETETELNVFTLGLALIGQYHEIKNKKIHLGMLSELIDLQQCGEDNIDNEDIMKAYYFSDFVYERTMTLPIK